MEALAISCLIGVAMLGGVSSLIILCQGRDAPSGGGTSA